MKKKLMIGAGGGMVEQRGHDVAEVVHLDARALRDLGQLEELPARILEALGARLAGDALEAPHDVARVLANDVGDLLRLLDDPTRPAVGGVLQERGALGEVQLRPPGVEHRLRPEVAAHKAGAGLQNARSYSAKASGSMKPSPKLPQPPNLACK